MPNPTSTRRGDPGDIYHREDPGFEVSAKMNAIREPLERKIGIQNGVVPSLQFLFKAKEYNFSVTAGLHGRQVEIESDNCKVTLNYSRGKCEYAFESKERRNKMPIHRATSRAFEIAGFLAEIFTPELIRVLIPQEKINADIWSSSLFALTFKDPWKKAQSF